MTRIASLFSVVAGTAFCALASYAAEPAPRISIGPTPAAQPQGVSPAVSDWNEARYVFTGKLDSVQAGPVGQSFPPVYTHTLGFEVQRVPALLIDGNKVLWEESLVILCQDKVYPCPGFKGVPEGVKPAELQPGESVSTVVNAPASERSRVAARRLPHRIPVLLGRIEPDQVVLLHVTSSRWPASRGLHRTIMFVRSEMM